MNFNNENELRGRESQVYTYEKRKSFSLSVLMISYSRHFQYLPFISRSFHFDNYFNFFSSLPPFFSLPKKINKRERYKKMNWTYVTDDDS